LVEDVRELDFVFLTGNVPDVRGAYNIRHDQKWVMNVVNGFLLEHIDRGTRDTSLRQGLV